MLSLHDEDTHLLKTISSGVQEMVMILSIISKRPPCSMNIHHVPMRSTIVRSRCKVLSGINSVSKEDFLRTFLNKNVFEMLEAHFKETKKWSSLDNAYVNFTHWAFVRGGHDSIPYQKEGFYLSWLRHNAYICQSNFPSVDLVIPMAFPNPDGTVSSENVSFIVISIKNCEGNEGYRMTFLPNEAVEGVITVESPRKKRKIIDEAKADDNDQHELKTKYTCCDRNLNVRLTLHALKFINPNGVTSATGDDECWIKPSEDKPYIAFAMSMGETEREQNLFVGEKDVRS